MNPFTCVLIWILRLISSFWIFHCSAYSWPPEGSTECRCSFQTPQMSFSSPTNELQLIWSGEKGQMTHLLVFSRAEVLPDSQKSSKGAIGHVSEVCLMLKFVFENPLFFCSDSLGFFLSPPKALRRSGAEWFIISSRLRPQWIGSGIFIKEIIIGRNQYPVCVHYKMRWRTEKESFPLQSSNRTFILEMASFPALIILVFQAPPGWGLECFLRRSILKPQRLRGQTLIRSALDLLVRHHKTPPPASLRPEGGMEPTPGRRSAPLGVGRR